MLTLFTVPKTIKHKFHTSTLKQKRILFAGFDRLTSLQAWADRAISWLDTIVFYIGHIIVSFLITATPRTQKAKILLFCTIPASPL
jgi:hypothetical protein